MTLRWLAVAAILVMIVAPRTATGLEIVSVSDNAYALVGEMDQRSPANLGNNATFGLVVTPEGAILIDAGGSYKGAAEIDAAIRSVTDKPVKIVINTGGQDHRWLGNSYWKQRGAQIITSTAAVGDQQARASQQLSMLRALIGEAALEGTEVRYADKSFNDSYEVELGGVKLILNHFGTAHTPGDLSVFEPQNRVLFAGDIVFLDRMLGVLPVSDSKSWVDTLNALIAMTPAIVVPGHGVPGKLDKVRSDSLDYLTYLRKAVRAHLDKGGDLKSVVEIDQDQFQHLKLFDSLAKRNAMAVFTELEFE